MVEETGATRRGQGRVNRARGLRLTVGGCSGSRGGPIRWPLPGAGARYLAAHNGPCRGSSVATHCAKVAMPSAVRALLFSGCFWTAVFKISIPCARTASQSAAVSCALDTFQLPDGPSRAAFLVAGTIGYHPTKASKAAWWGVIWFFAFRSWCKPVGIESRQTPPPGQTWSSGFQMDSSCQGQSGGHGARPPSCAGGS